MEQKQCANVGGQAVLDGVMMKAPTHIAVAVRRSSGDIVVSRSPYESPEKKHPWMGKPFIRGAVNMVLMMRLGMKVLEDSARMGDQTDGQTESRFEKWLDKRLGKNAEKIMMTAALLLSFLLSIGLFVLLPNLPVKALRAAGWSLFSVNLISGLIRIVILIGYLLLSGQQKDLRRTFQYHGSEHKTIYCLEHGLDMTVRNVQRFSTLHPRCGTSFLLLTFIISILFYSVIDQTVFSVFGLDLGKSYPLRVLSRLILLPLVAGVSYETLKALAKTETPLTRALRWPGLQLQRLTTRQPEDDMCEVAMVSVLTALYGLPEKQPDENGWVILNKEETFAFLSAQHG